MQQFLQEIWPHLTVAVTFSVTVLAAGHAILTKRETSAAVGWVAVIWLVPFVGSILYFLLGINRIRRKATQKRRDLPSLPERPDRERVGPDRLVEKLSVGSRHLAALARSGFGVTGRDLLDGNCVVPLINGDEAYPRMLRAIENAEGSVTLTTYIFGNDATGRQFTEALSKAVARGVEVRVLIDSVGSRYSFPPIVWRLRREGVPTATFMPTLFLWYLNYVNLRSHHKIMVVDGKLGFTGGMNISQSNRVSESSSCPVQDLHFEVTGPLVGDMQEVFVHDWAFSTGELLEGELWFPHLEARGPVIARGITDGPDEDYDSLRMILLSAIACAQKKIHIATPYFLPDGPLISALNAAAMRGVSVDILLPEVNNLRVVQWASRAQLAEVLRWGCRIWLTPPPFDHTKLMIVDEVWSLIGSGNWDPRSLSLNFEFNVECYNEDLGYRLETLFERKRRKARQLSLEEMESRSLPIKLRDGIARLFSPYL